MYENQNQYPNQYPNQEQTQSRYGNYGSASYSNYDFGSSEANRGTVYGTSAGGNVNDSENHIRTPKKKEPSGVAAFLKKALLCASLGLFFGLCAGIGIYAVQQVTAEDGKEAAVSSSNPNTAETVPSTGVADNGSQTVQTALGQQSITMVDTDITGVVEAVMPAMVSIGNEFKEQYSYFGQTFSQDAESAGSGIIVGKNDTELLIATNYHVVEKADKLTVTFIDNTKVTAQLKGTDAGMDLAVLAVSLEEMSEDTLDQVVIAKLGDSESLKLGEPVIAIGNALGYGQSVTNGIVSALNREVQLSNGTTGTFIQTNAAINPGNSGGALLNLEGEVIGINSNKIGGDVVEGMGYAIPISAAKPIITELMLKETKTKVKDGEVGYIGFQPATVTAEISEMYGMPRGVYVTRVVEGSPAEKAGLLKGDIITAIDGSTVSSYEDLQEEMLYHASGTTVEITVQRNGSQGYQEMTFSVTLGSKTN